MNRPVDLGEADPRSYVRLAARIRKQIMSGDLMSGRPVPSITTLSQELGHARQSCGKAKVARNHNHYYVALRRHDAGSSPAIPSAGQAPINRPALTFGCPRFATRMGPENPLRPDWTRRVYMPRSARLRRSAGLAGGHCGCRRACSSQGVGAAQCVRQPVPAGHAPDQVRRVGCRHPGGSDEQRAHRGSAHDWHRVGSRAEPGLGHPDHWDAEFGVRMDTQAGPPAGSRSA